MREEKPRPQQPQPQQPQQPQKPTPPTGRLIKEGAAPSRKKQSQDRSIRGI